jgi:hypothetical protein
MPLYDVIKETDDATAVASTSVTLVELVHPLASITVTVCVPAAKPEVVVASASPELQAYDHDPTPPVANTVAAPSERPLQLICSPLYEVKGEAVAETAAGSTIVILPVP